MFKIIERKYDYDPDSCAAICAVFADSVADLPDETTCRLNGIAPGSWCWCADEVTFATLKSTYSWVVADE